MTDAVNPGPVATAPRVRNSHSSELEHSEDTSTKPAAQTADDATEYFGTSTKIVRRGRGKAQASLDLIEAMRQTAEKSYPISARGIAYKLFVAGLIPSMARKETRRASRLLLDARESGVIPWQWIVDETRSLERVSTWSDPEEFAACAAQSYRRDFWDQQDVRVEVWSEKGTIRGVLEPVLKQYAVGFR